MITLGVYSPAPNDATSWYRCFGPLRYVRRNYDIEIITLNPQTCNWYDVGRCDVVLLQRPAIDFDIWNKVFECCRLCGVPMWVDYDDYLMEVPSWNPNASLFATPDNLKTVRTALELADIVTVSTPDLAKVYAPFNNNIMVIGNAWEPALNMKISKKKIEGKTHIVWRGGGSHGVDLAYGAKFFLGLDPEKYHVTFLGYCPDFILWARDNVTVIQQPMAVPNFLRVLAGLRPDYVVVPLIDDPFNRCKSDIAYLEATKAGALCVAPNWDSWNSNDGILLYDSKEDFETQARILIEQSADKFVELYSRAEAHVVNVRSANCDDILNARWQVISTLAARGVK